MEPFLVMLPLFFGCNGDFNGKRAKKHNILKKALSDGPSANLRPLYNSNVAKVSIVKWSQILISAVGSRVSGITIFYKNALKTQFFEIFGYVRNGTSNSQNLNLRPLYNRYFCHITIVK